MKRLLLNVCAMLLVFGMLGVANATLWDRGGGLIYDDVLEITWLQNANIAGTSMNWEDAGDWAGSLSYYDSVRDVTWSNWRLPDAHNMDGSGPDVGYDVTGSEMGHMYYTNLGNAAFVGEDLNVTFNSGGPGGPEVSFLNVTNGFTYPYWSGTGTDHWAYKIAFHFFSGCTNVETHTSEKYIWPVMDGDVGAIPIPSAIWLLGSGLIGIVGIRRKFKK